MSKSVSKRNFVGIVGIIISIATITVVSIYFSSYSNMNSEFVENKISTNMHDLTYHSTDGSNSELNLDENTSLLIALWIGLMIVGSYLLFHIHFKVLQKE